MNPQSQHKLIHNPILLTSSPSSAIIPIQPQHNIHSSTIHPSHPHTPTCHFPSSKRKIKPKYCQPILAQSLPIAQKMATIDSLTNECLRGYKEDDNIRWAHLWIYDEYFVSNCDKEFFESAKMSEIVEQLQFDKMHISLRVMGLIKKSLPKPALFGKFFLHKQRQELQKERMKNTKKYKKNIFTLDTKANVSLQVGDNIWALHPLCKHLHSGTVFAHFKENIYTIKFKELGTFQLPDFTISSTFLNAQHSEFGMLKYMENVQMNKIEVENVDLKNLASYMKFIELKSDLIQILRQYHEMAFKLREKRQILSETQLQQYGWIGSIISLINIIIKYMNSYYLIPFLQKKQNLRTQKYQKLPIICPNPLYTQISSGATLSDESEDKKQQKNDQKNQSSINMIKEKELIEEVLQKISVKNSLLLGEVEEGSEKRQLQDIIKSLMGILSGIKSKGKEFNSVQDKYLKKLDRLIGKKYPEHFNDIYDMIRSLLRKLP